MAVGLHVVVHHAARGVTRLDRERAAKNQPATYLTPKEGMLDLHRAWQTLVLAVRAGAEVDGQVAEYAVDLASAALKFASDLGERETARRLDARQRLL